MIRGWFLALLAGVTFVPAAPAQGWRFAWKPGQVLTYRLERTTSESSVVDDNKVDTSSKLNVVKSWKVTDVDAAGVATVEYSLTAFRMERTIPSGEVLLFDSADPDKSTPQLREQFSKYVGKPLAVLRVDGQGKVVEVKESKDLQATRWESEPPFVLTLPAQAPQAGQGWERAYAITLEPPQGTGEKYQSAQRYVCRNVEGGLATISLATALTAAPGANADQVPLLEHLPEGEVVFDTEAGCVRSARLTIDKELKPYMGEGSSFRFRSTYVEELVK